MNLALRLFAGVIDLLQFIFFIVLLAFQFMTPIGGGISGAATAAYVCWNLSSGIWEGISSAAACAAGGGVIGAGVSAFATPIGMAIDIAISSTFGVLLILALWVTGRFSFMAVVMGFSSEMLPGINAFVPGWSILVHRCIKSHKQKQASEGAGSTFTSALTVASIIPGVGSALAAAKPVTRAFSIATNDADAVKQAPSRIPLQTRNFDGIRPTTNDKHLRQSYAQAA